MASTALPFRIRPLRSASAACSRPLCIREAPSQVRFASQKSNKSKKSEKKRKPRSTYIYQDPKLGEQWALCDAIRYLRAFEVGKPPTSAKYEMHVRLKTLKNGPTVRNRLRLPHPVKTDLRICVICPPESKQAQMAKKLGASVVGEEEVFDAIKDGRIEFDRCLCHIDSSTKLNRAGVARILGPRGLMPSAKMGTVVKDVTTGVRNMVGGSEYRERSGVVRMSVGQLGFTPEEVQKNIRAFMDSIRADIGRLSDRMSKEVHEVVLSSTSGPGFSLNGDFRSEISPPSRDLSVL